MASRVAGGSSVARTFMRRSLAQPLLSLGVKALRLMHSVKAEL